MFQFKRFGFVALVFCMFLVSISYTKATDPDPTAEILKKIAAAEEKVKDALKNLEGIDDEINSAYTEHQKKLKITQKKKEALENIQNPKDGEEKAGEVVVQHFKTNYDNAKKKSDEAEGVWQSHLSRKKVLTDNVTKANEELKLAKKPLEEAKTKKEKAEAEVREKVELKQKVALLEQELEKLKTAQTQTKLKVECIDDKVNKLDGRVGTLENELANLKNRMTAIERLSFGSKAELEYAVCLISDMRSVMNGATKEELREYFKLLQSTCKGTATFVEYPIIHEYYQCAPVAYRGTLTIKYWSFVTDQYGRTIVRAHGG